MWHKSRSPSTQKAKISVSLHFSSKEGSLRGGSAGEKMDEDAVEHEVHKMDEGIRMVSMVVHKTVQRSSSINIRRDRGAPLSFNSPLTQHEAAATKSSKQYRHYVDSRSNIGLCVCNLHPSSPLRL